MGRTKSRKGGEVTDEQIASSIQNLENKLNAVQTSLDNLKQKLNVSPAMQPEMQEEIPKPWQNNKDIKFKDGEGGRVTLSFPRIIMLIDKNIQQNNTNKPWAEIKDKLLEAKSIQEVQSEINQYSIRFSSNYVGGTRKKRRGGKRRRTSKRY